ncbi:MAG: hypothetical protein LBT96_04650 [Campylobacteraceae bacterium]|nr:hypothetical protein [Campylobacteraceae bacterium]
MKRFFDNLRNKAKQFLDALKQLYHDKFDKSYDNRVIFVDTKHIAIGDLNAFDVILSPKYYWTKIETLPVKYAFQAKEYAPSVFEGFIPKGDYSYKAVKQSGNFLLFAYDVKDILENLESLGVKSSYIRKVYFAQTEFANCSSDIKIDNKSVLAIRNGKVIKTPLTLSKQYISIKEALQTLKPSKNTIKLGKFNRIYEKQGSLKGVICVLVFLITLFFGELLYLANILNSQDSQREEILKQHSLPSTEIQLNALLKQQERINKEQKAIRDKISEVLKFPFLEGEYFSNVEASQAQISLVLHSNDKSRSSTVRSYFQKSFTIDEFRDNTNDIRIKLRYE